MGRFIFGSLGLLLVAFSLNGIGADHHCPFDWFSHNEFCYKLFKDRKSWDNAERICQEEQENGHLAFIQDVEESVVLSDQISKTFGIPHISDVWIGLRLSKRTGKWGWSDGSNITLTRWEKGEPNNFLKKEFCAALTLKSRYLEWNDKICALRHRFLCKFEPGREANA